MVCHTLNKVQNIAPVGVGKELSIALESQNWFDEGLAYFRAEASVGIFVLRHYCAISVVRTYERKKLLYTQYSSYLRNFIRCFEGLIETVGI